MAQQSQVYGESPQSLNSETNIPYEQLVETDEFKNLLKRKMGFIVPMTIFFLLFYFMLPLLAGYTKLLHTEVIGSITGAWIFAALQFVLVWTCGYIYVKKSEKLDNLSQGILNKFRKELNQ